MNEKQLSGVDAADVLGVVPSRRQVWPPKVPAKPSKRRRLRVVEEAPVESRRVHFTTVRIGGGVCGSCLEVLVRGEEAAIVGGRLVHKRLLCISRA